MNALYASGIPGLSFDPPWVDPGRLRGEPLPGAPRSGGGRSLGGPAAGPSLWGPLVQPGEFGDPWGGGGIDLSIPLREIHLDRGPIEIGPRKGPTRTTRTVDCWLPELPLPRNKKKNVSCFSRRGDPDAFDDLDRAYYEVDLPRECCQYSAMDARKRPCLGPSAGQLEDAARRITITHDYLPVDERAAVDELFATAWFFLVENLDIIQWLTCYFQETGAVHGGTVHVAALNACIEDAILGGGTEIRADLVEEQYANTNIWVSQGAIWYSPLAAGNFHKSHLTPWTRNWPGSMGRFCVGLVLAGTLVSEVLHLCGAKHDLTVDDCDYTMFVKHAFLHLMTQRYACDWSEACCGEFTDPSWFFYDLQGQHAAGC